MSYSNLNPRYLEPEAETKEKKRKKKNRKDKNVRFAEQEEKIKLSSSDIENNLEKTNKPASSFNDTDNNVILESKFSLRNILIKVLLFVLFIIVIYLTYLFIFKKKKFLELINHLNPFKSTLRLKSKSLPTTSDNMSVTNLEPSKLSSDLLSNSKENISSSSLISENLVSNKIDNTSSFTETQKIDPSLKGGQEYIDNNQLVNDIMAILKQAN